MPRPAGPPARSHRLVGLRRARAGRSRRSFDVFSQAALFAVTAARFGGWPPTLLFTTGMLVTDGQRLVDLAPHPDERA